MKKIALLKLGDFKDLRWTHFDGKLRNVLLNNQRTQIQRFSICPKNCE